MIIRILILFCALLCLTGGCTALHPSSNFFAFEKADRLIRPEVVIKNNSDSDITITISGAQHQKFQLKPFSLKKIVLEPGPYTFHATSSVSVSSTVFSRIEAKKRYFLNFYVGKN